jgi:hypothetical protein
MLKIFLSGKESIFIHTQANPFDHPIIKFLIIPVPRMGIEMRREIRNEEMENNSDSITVNFLIIPD